MIYTWGLASRVKPQERRDRLQNGYGTNSGGMCQLCETN